MLNNNQPTCNICTLQTLIKNHMITTLINSKANRTVVPIVATVLFTLFIAFQIAAMFKLI